MPDEFLKVLVWVVVAGFGLGLLMVSVMFIIFVVQAARVLRDPSAQRRGARRGQTGSQRRIKAREMDSEEMEQQIQHAQHAQAQQMHQQALMGAMLVQADADRNQQMMDQADQDIDFGMDSGSDYNTDYGSGNDW